MTAKVDFADAETALLSPASAGDALERDAPKQDSSISPPPTQISPSSLGLFRQISPASISLLRQISPGSFVRQMSKETNAEVDEVTRANRATAVSISIAICAVSALLTVPDSAQGLVAAMGAVLCFGVSNLPAKHPAASNIGPVGFLIWVTVGNALCNVLLLTLLQQTMRWNMWGCVGAACLTMTQLCALSAINRLGVAVGPGIWSGVGMFVSFVWGNFIFGEKMACPYVVTASLALLAVGVGGVASSELLEPTKVLSPTRRERRERLWANPTPDVRFEDMYHLQATRDMAIGIVFALCTGCFDGSMMAAFSFFKRSPHLLSMTEEEVALSYLGSFALAIPVVALPPLFLVLCVQTLSARRGKDLHELGDCGDAWKDLHRAALPGICSGVLWASGNTLSVHATLRLGQAVGFPLTQSCVLVSGLWGIFYFRELTHWKALTLFGVASMTIIAGAVGLKVGGNGL